MMNYLNYNDYRAIYQKYINRENLLGMIDLIDDYKGKSFLDLCCGDGAAAREAMNRGAEEAFMVDQEIKMLADDLYPEMPGMSFWNGSVEEFICMSDGDETYHEILKELKFDIIFCRQGINYWYKPGLMGFVANMMEKDGVFIFNTFNTKPSRKASVKEYEIDGVNFTEISYLVSDCVVHHVQISEGYPPHLTEFKWVSEKEFKHGLDPYFNIELRRRNNTDVYICRKK